MERSPHLTSILAARISTQPGPVTAPDVVCAVIKDGANRGARLLASFGVELPEPAPVTGRSSADGLEPDAVALLVAAAGVADELGDEAVEPEHVVLAAADGGDPVHAGMYRLLGLRPDLLREQLARLRAGRTDLLEPEPDEAYLDEIEAAMHALADDARS
jgi:hypothetical protein